MSNVPHPSDATKRASARTTMPAEICDHYSEVPRALRQHAHALGLSLADVGFIYVLWSFKFFADSPINPAMDTLARELGTSVDTVSRSVKRLERLGVLRVERKGPGKRAPVAGYDLDPLWQKLAKIVREARPDLRVVRESADTSVRESADRIRTSADTVRESADQSSANLRIEVEEAEVNEGTRRREGARASARTAPSLSIDEQIGLLQRDIDDPTTYGSTRLKAYEQIRRLDRQRLGVVGRDEQTERWLQDARAEGLLPGGSGGRVGASREETVDERYERRREASQRVVAAGGTSFMREDD